MEKSHFIHSLYGKESYDIYILINQCFTQPGKENEKVKICQHKTVGKTVSFFLHNSSCT